MEPTKPVMVELARRNFGFRFSQFLPFDRGQRVAVIVPLPAHAASRNDVDATQTAECP
jgi:hypothetical protein